jgi:hypothetical protein
LSEAVKHNSAAIEKQATAMEALTRIMINDVRQDQELISMRRDLSIIWDELKDHRGKSTYDRD